MINFCLDFIFIDNLIFLKIFITTYLGTYFKEAWIHTTYFIATYFTSILAREANKQFRLFQKNQSPELNFNEKRFNFCTNSL